MLAQSMTGTALSNLNLTSLRNQFIIGLLIRGQIYITPAAGCAVGARHDAMACCSLEFVMCVPFS